MRRIVGILGLEVLLFSCLTHGLPIAGVEKQYFDRKSSTGLEKRLVPSARSVLDEGFFCDGGPTIVDSSFVMGCKKYAAGAATAGQSSKSLEGDPALTVPEPPSEPLDSSPSNSSPLFIPSPAIQLPTTPQPPQPLLLPPADFPTPKPPTIKVPPLQVPPLEGPKPDSRPGLQPGFSPAPQSPNDESPSPSETTDDQAFKKISTPSEQSQIIPIPRQGSSSPQYFPSGYSSTEAFLSFPPSDA